MVENEHRIFINATENIRFEKPNFLKEKNKYVKFQKFEKSLILSSSFDEFHLVHIAYSQFEIHSHFISQALASFKPTNQANQGECVIHAIFERIQRTHPLVGKRKLQKLCGDHFFHVIYDIFFSSEALFFFSSLNKRRVLLLVSCNCFESKTKLRVAEAKQDSIKIRTVDITLL